MKDLTYTYYKRNLDFLLDWTEKQKEMIREIKYPANDVRKDFFKLSYTNVYHYYIGYFNLFTSHTAKDGYLKLDDSLSNFKIHVDRWAEISHFPVLERGNFNTLNQRLFVFAWSIFELAVSTFFAAVADEEELQKILSMDYNEVLKCVIVNEGKEDKLKKILIKNNLAHVSINRKYNYLLKKVRGYGRSVIDDRAFLDFFGKMRNTMHTNFIYFGQDYEYRFGQAHFVFENNKQVVWSDPFDEGNIPNVKLYIYLIGHLNEIFREIIRCIFHEGVILYPDPTTE